MINVVISIILLALLLPSAVSVPTTPPACSRFFDLTVENFHSSGVSEAYSAWVKEASARPEFTDVGEVSLFFQDHGFRDVECGVTWLGCKNAPSCESIRDAFAGNDEEARRVYFVSQIVQNIALIAGLVYRTTTDVQIDTSNIIPAATETFFWQPDAKNARLCVFIGQAAKDMVNFSIVIFFVLSPPLLGSAVGAAAVGANLSWMRMASNILGNPWVSTSIQMFSGSYISLGIDKGCNRFLPVAGDQRFEHMSQLGGQLRNVMMSYRKHISSSTMAITRGIGFGDDGAIVDGKTVLSDIVSSGYYFVVNAAARDKFVNNPFQLEEALTQRVTNGIISACLTSSQCYLSCTEREARGFCEASSPLAASRFCPGPNTACQAQCWRPSTKAKNVALYGLASLDNSLWNVRIEDMLSASYHSYTDPGVKDTALPDPGEFLENPMDSPETRGSGFRIPVCVSELLQTGDFLRHGSKNNGLFPCSCGNVYSNETSGFLAASGFSTSSHKKELMRKCPRQLNKMVPLALEHFLALCALHVRWPLRHESRFIQAGADRRCYKVMEDVNQRMGMGVGRMEMNRWFCTESAEGLDLRKDELHWVAFPHMRGHDDRCKEFLSSSSKFG